MFGLTCAGGWSISGAHQLLPHTLTLTDAVTLLPHAAQRPAVLCSLHGAAAITVLWEGAQAQSFSDLANETC